VRRVTAGELRCLGVKHGPDLPLPSDPSSKVALAKAQMMHCLEKHFGGDFKKWLSAVKSVKTGPNYAGLSDVTKRALDELEAELSFAGQWAEHWGHGKRRGK